MEKRVVIFLVLALIIVFGWNYILREMGMIPELPDSQQTDTPVKDGTPSGSTTASADSKAVPVQKSKRETGADSLQAEGPGMPEGSLVTEEVVKVETELFRASLSNRGGVIQSWELLRYSDKTPDGPVPVQLVYQGGRFKGPLSLRLDDEALTRELSEGLYEVERDFTRLDESHPVGRLTFRYRDAEKGVTVEKELRFHYQKYLVDVRVRTQGIAGALAVGLGTNFGIVEWGEGFIGLVGPAFLVGDEVEKENPDEALVRPGPVRWVSLQDKYFTSVLIPQEADAVLVKNQGEKLVSAGVRFPEPARAALQLYAGPKEYDTLSGLNVRLEETIDFGWFIYGSWTIVRWLAKPLFFLLRYFYEYTHNYGFAIILLTVCIRLFFVPLQYKSYKSMKDMQSLQPKMKELQEKYKDDKQEMNQELFKLYREHKVNPLGGCLPMFLQMPVFVALFNILYMTIDLRQAPFILWIDDLSMPDPFYVLPILMGVSMFVQQKIMPTTMEPTQAKIMLMLPVFMTFIFLNFASGLVLYWFTNNVLAVSQQFITDRFIFKRPTFAAPAASPSKPPPPSGDADGRRPGGGKRKGKKSRKAEADSPVES